MYRPVDGPRSPRKISSSSSVIAADDSSKVALQPAVRSWPTDINVCDRLGTICAVRASGGRRSVANGNCIVVDDANREPSGRTIEMGGDGSVSETKGDESAM